MKKIIFALSLVLLAAAGWSQARIPVNEANTGGTTKPNTTPPVTNSGSNTSSELIKYSDPKGRFTIGYPGDWNLNDKTESAIIQVTSPSEGEDDKFRQNVNLQIEDLGNGTTIEDYVKTNMDAVKGIVKGYREVSSMYFNRNGAKAYQIVYKGKYGEMTYDIQIRQLFCLSNGKGYVLTYVCKEDERDAFETTSNKIFNSFKNL